MGTQPTTSWREPINSGRYEDSMGPRTPGLVILKYWLNSSFGAHGSQAHFLSWLSDWMPWGKSTDEIVKDLCALVLWTSLKWDLSCGPGSENLGTRIRIRSDRILKTFEDHLASARPSVEAWTTSQRCTLAKDALVRLGRMSPVDRGCGEDQAALSDSIRLKSFLYGSEEG